MTVGEIISELKKYGQTLSVMFVSRSGDKEHVRLVLLDDLRISKVFLSPHGADTIGYSVVRILLAGELASRLNRLGSAFLSSDVFFLAQANEAAPIYRVGVSDDGDVVILSGEK